MSNPSEYNYENIDIPYDVELNRSSSDAFSLGASETSATNMVSGKGFENMWINTWIKSRNYLPKKRGFLIDGTNGYIECMKLYVGNGGIVGGKVDIPDTTSANSFHVDVDGNTWWGSTAIGTSVAKVLNTGAATFTGITINSGTIDGTSTIGGRDGSVLATAIDSVGHFADDAINTALGTIIGEFNFTGSGALQIGEYVNGVSGDIRISPNGILGRDDTGATTFSINGTTGVAVLNGLVVGTNVGIGTAFPTASAGDLAVLDLVETAQLGTTVIVGGYIKTDLLTADNTVAGTLTGRTVRTATTGKRVEMNNSDNSIKFWNSDGVATGSIYGNVAGGDLLWINASTGLWIQAATYINDDLSCGDLSVVGKIETQGNIVSTVSDKDLGDTSNKWRDLHLSGHIIGETPYQFSQAADYTSSQTVTITTTFKPKEVHLSGYVYYGTPNVKWGTTNGFAGVVSPTAGKCNCWTIEGVTYNIAIGTYNYLGGNSIAYCYVSSWDATGIKLTIVCPSTWVIGTNILITG